MKLKFTLRDLMWLIVVVGLATGWVADRYRQSAKQKQLKADFATAVEILTAVERSAKNEAYQVKWQSFDKVLIHGPKGTRTIQGDAVNEITHLLERRTDW